MSMDKKAHLGISGRMAKAFKVNAMTPLLALVAMLLGLFAVLAVSYTHLTLPTNREV